MAINDKTRKKLWAKSGNRCSLCGIELVQNSNLAETSIIFGEECHIIASKENGPRGRAEYDDLDSYNNLILLCANDHKRIDELIDFYTIEKIRLIKKNHEEWVRSTLERDVSAFTNDKNRIKSLLRIRSGKQIIDIIIGSQVFNFDHDELETRKEADLIGNLFEELKDYGEIAADLGYSEISKLGVHYNTEIKEIEKAGFLLFGLRRRIRLKNATHEDVGVYDMASLAIVRQNNPSIIDDFLIEKFSA